MRALFSGWLGEGRGHGLHRRSLAGQLSVSTGGDWIGEFAGGSLPGQWKPVDRPPHHGPAWVRAGLRRATTVTSPGGGGRDDVRTARCVVADWQPPTVDHHGFACSQPERNNDVVAWLAVQRSVCAQPAARRGRSLPRSSTCVHSRFRVQGVELVLDLCVRDGRCRVVTHHAIDFRQRPRPCGPSANALGKHRPWRK